MTPRKNSAAKSSLKELLSEDQDLLRGLMKQALEQVLEAEMSEALVAGKSGRSESRLGYRSGYYGRSLITRVGKLELRVPQDRQGRFRTEVFARYQRSEKALVHAVMEMYIQGVSTRKVKAITEELCGHEFSASTVSEMVQKLGEEPEAFAHRKLEEEYPEFRGQTELPLSQKLRPQAFLKVSSPSVHETFTKPSRNLETLR
jgi:putative transposase